MSEENPDKVIFTSTEHIDEKIGVTIYTEKIEFHGINVISKFKPKILRIIITYSKLYNFYLQRVIL